MNCQYKGKCGGCFYTDTKYSEELRLKEAKVLSLIKENINYDFTYESIIPSPLENEYKNKMEFTFGDSKKGGPLTLGMHEKRAFFNILNADECELIDDNMRNIVRLTRKFFDDKKISYYHKKTHEGYLRNLIIRKSFKSDTYMINLVTTSYDNINILQEWKDMLIVNIKSNLNILHTRNDAFADAVINEGIETIYGSDMMEEEVCGMCFNISPFSFFQTNTKGCEKLYEKIKEYAKDCKGTIYDMFCGTGTIGIILSEKANKVVGVEIVKEAIEKAKENCVKNGINNIEYIAKDINMVVKDKDKLVFDNKPDLIVLDPPRSGVNDKTLESILELKAKDIIYVSCKIESFIHNLNLFKSRGYKIEKVSMVDMFPRTDNVETVIKLSLVS